jgi:hypothetical protein
MLQKHEIQVSTFAVMPLPSFCHTSILMQSRVRIDGYAQFSFIKEDNLKKKKSSRNLNERQLTLSGSLPDLFRRVGTWNLFPKKIAPVYHLFSNQAWRF